MSQQTFNSGSVVRVTFFALLIILFILNGASVAAPMTMNLGLAVHYYSVSDSIYKNVYGDGGLMWGGHIDLGFWKGLELRGELNYFSDQGKLTVTDEVIRFQMMSYVFGLRYRLDKWAGIRPYLGAGIGGYSYSEELPNRFDDVKDSMPGYHAEGGMYIDLSRRLRLDLNIRYLKADTKPFEETIALGGIRVGVGFVLRLK